MSIFVDIIYYLKTVLILFMQNIILGAGFAGLSSGIKTGFPIFEASDGSGGICRSYKKDGFDFSNGGGHWVFGNGLGLEFIKSLVKLNTYERISDVYINTFFPYPFQTSSEKDIESNNGTLKHWLSNNFSKASCNIFLNPFNKRYTADLYDSIIQDDGFKTPSPGGKGFVPVFSDPIGGINTLINEMEKKCTINYSHEVIKIDTDNKIVYFSNHKSLKYKNIISTIPLNRCLKLCGNTSFSLPYTSVLVINIGAEKAKRTPKSHWIYIPYNNSASQFYRIGFYSNVNEDKAPNGKVSLSVEMAFKGIDFSDLDIERITKDVVEELQDWMFIGDAITVDPTWVKTAYTWLYNKDDRSKALKYLEDRNIFSTGRYGKWKFQGMVESISDGLSMDLERFL